MIVLFGDMGTGINLANNREIGFLNGMGPPPVAEKLISYFWSWAFRPFFTKNHDLTSHKTVQIILPWLHSIFQTKEKASLSVACNSSWRLPNDQLGSILRKFGIILDSFRVLKKS